MADLTVKISKVVNAHIDNVFNAWLDPHLLSQFILPMPDMPQPYVENNACLDGEFTILMQVGDEKIPHTGKYLEIDRPNKLVFTWNSPFSTDDSSVTLTFKDLGENKTRIELSHIKFIDEESRANHEGGWGNILENLNGILGS